MADEQGGLETLQNEDPEVDSIVAQSKFVVAYLLQQEGSTPGWRKLNIEGPVYVTQRRSQPRYQLIVRNQLSTNDLTDALHADWELDCQSNYVFYKKEDPANRIRGLWFHDDADRQKFARALEHALAVLRSDTSAPAPPMPTTTPAVPPAAQPVSALAVAQPAQPLPRPIPQEGYAGDVTLPQAVPKAAAAPTGKVTITKAKIRSAVHAMAEDDRFLDMLMTKISRTTT